MTKKWLPYAEYIMERIDILNEIQERTEGDICGDRIIYDAVLYSLFTLADAAGKLPDDVKAEFGHIEWNDIRGFRNFIVHEYEGHNVDKDIVMDVIRNKIPELKTVVETLLAREQGRDSDF